MTEQTAPSWLAITAAVTPLAVSLAANITWGVSTGSAILVVAGIVTPLLLVLAIERWRIMPPADGTQWWVRTLAMSGVVVVVAGWSWLHATALLLAEVEALHPWPPAPGTDTVLRNVEQTLCVLAPLAVDGLAVLSVLALDVQGRTEPDTPTRTAEQPARTECRQAEEPMRRPAKTTVANLSNAEDDEAVRDLRAWVRETGRVPSGYEVRQRYGCGHRRANRLLGQLDATEPDRAGQTVPTEPGDRADRAGDRDTDRAGTGARSRERALTS